MRNSIRRGEREMRNSVRHREREMTTFDRLEDSFYVNTAIDRSG